MDWLKKYKLHFERFLIFNSEDKLLFFESWIEILKVIVILRTPYRQRLFNRNKNCKKYSNDPTDLNHMTLFLDRAANYHIKHVTCLERVLALQSMVIKRGSFVKVNIGVKGNGADFEAHAWIDEYHTGNTTNEFSELIPVNEHKR